MLSKLSVLLQIAVRNLFASLLNVFIGVVIVLGTVLLVVGGSLFQTLDQSLSKSIVGSVTGNLQVYASRSKDVLSVYGKFDGTDATLSPIENFAEVKKKLLSHPNVERVVPMGTSGAMLGSGNTVDVTLEKLRNLYRDKLENSSKLSPEELTAQIEASKAHVRQIITVLGQDAARTRAVVAAANAVDVDEQAALAKASSEEFWASFDASPYEHLEFLENKLATQVADADLLFIRYLGTDMAAYQQTFDRLDIAVGQPIPAGKRGLLLPQFFYEESLKLKNARRLDKIKDARDAGRRLADANDKELQRFVRENVAQTREFVLQLDSLQTQVAVSKLQALLKSQETDFSKLLQAFFATTDDNFDERYAFFYKELAPMLSLYRIKVGDTVNLKSFGRSGSAESVNVKLYGTFQFKGLEKSPLAGALALIDMVSFRDLYGYLTPDRAAELKEMKAQTAAKEVSRENAEADLFGGGGELTVAAKATDIDDETAFRGGLRETAKAREAREYTADEMQEGVVLHAAIQLKDGSPLAAEKTRQELAAMFDGERPKPAAQSIEVVKAGLNGLSYPFRAALEPVLAGEAARATGGAGPTPDQVRAASEAYRTDRTDKSPELKAAIDTLLQSARPPLWVVPWNDAAGMLGQVILFFRAGLGLLASALAMVTLIIITIAMVIATMQRTSTIGTLRAVGAQREFVLSMVLAETAALVAVFGAIGIGLGAAVVTWLGATGIPAFRDELYFFFSGPKLLPQLTAGSVLTAIITMGVVCGLSALIPAVMATRVSPLRAMQTD